MLKVSKSKVKRSDVAKSRSVSQEKERAKKLGGYTTSGSGNKREKGDVRKRGVIRVECKATTKKSFSITTEMLNKIYNAALPCAEVPVIEVEFLNEAGKVIRSVSVIPTYIIDEVFGS